MADIGTIWEAGTWVTDSWAADSWADVAESGQTITFGAASTVSKWSNESGAKTASLALGAESNRIVIGVVSVGNTLDSTPTFNGTNMTLAKEQFNGSGYARIYYLLEASLPGAGSYNFSVDPNGATYGCMAVFYIYNAKQAAPEADASGTGSSSTPSTNITTVTDNAWVVDCCNEIGGVSGTAGAGQTERFDDYSTSRGFVVSTKPVASAGLTSLSWTLSASSQYAHVLAAFAPAELGNSFYYRAQQ